MGKLLLALEALRKGSMLADPAAWKNRAAATALLTAFLAVLLKIARAYGYEIPLSDEDVGYIAGTIVLGVLLYFNYATSDKVGLFPSKPDPEDGVQSGSQAEAAPERDVSGPN